MKLTTTINIIFIRYTGSILPINIICLNFKINKNLLLNLIKINN